MIKDILQDKNEFFTVMQIQSIFNVSNQTARNDLMGLEKVKILEQKIIGKKAQFFASDNFEEQLKQNK